ncbi:MAG: hypothetical protein NT154_22615 [Verrucomicrobia bacterium]|nr:hypothetical protein [Verrucomicrobiota bacterium]
MRTDIGRRVGVRGFHKAIRLLPIGLASLGLVLQVAAAAEVGTGDESFKLREVSAFDSGPEGGQDGFLRGQAGECQDQPFDQVKAYPAFASIKPIYGSIHFFRDRRQPGTAQIIYFALDESRGIGKGYDRLYFDANGDLDLRNDPVLQPQRNPPEKARVNYGGIKAQVIFDFLAVNFDFGPAGMRPVQLMPRLTITASDKDEYKQMTFVRTRLYRGNIKIGGEPYEVRLGNQYTISGRLDAPGTTLLLSPKNRPGNRTGWWGGDSLLAAHKVKGLFYTFSASPTGDQLTVHPYRGELGTFEVGPGGRKLDKMTITGSLDGEQRAVAVGGEVADSSPKAAQSCQLPVGDYRPNFISIQYGRLHINASHNYHADGKPMGWSERAAVYAVAIRKDKPFALDFSNKPDVMFASPSKDKRVKLGESLEVKAVLVDPKLDMMIRNLDDTTRKQTKGADGQPINYQRSLSLDPQVIITRANGEKVAEGVMPFG